MPIARSIKDYLVPLITLTCFELISPSAFSGNNMRTASDFRLPIRTSHRSMTSPTARISSSCLAILTAFSFLKVNAQQKTIIHYRLNDHHAALVASGSVPSTTTSYGDGTTGDFGTVITLPTDIPTDGIPYGAGNRSINCVGPGSSLTEMPAQMALPSFSWMENHSAACSHSLPRHRLSISGLANSAAG